MKTKSLPPYAPTLIESTRAIGYSLEAAVADIIDNSIAANAKNVDIYFFPIDGAYIAILDNGKGMTEKEIDIAMQYGSKNPTEERDKKDLGRFGLGLKTASLSQCRCLTVISKQGDNLEGRQWDIDHVTEVGDWSLNVLDEEDIQQIPQFDELIKNESGTLVVWQKLDRLKSGEINFELSLGRKIDRVRDHLSLVYHRYLAGESGITKLKLSINGEKIKGIDPFLTEKSVQAMDDETLVIQGEPEFLISIMNRHKDWAVIVCLVGGGQEIYNGEAGIQDWFETLADNYPGWKVYLSDKITDTEYVGKSDISTLLHGRKYHCISDLHLGVSLRSFRSEKLAQFVKLLLDEKAEEAQSVNNELKQSYPIFLTRDFEIAKKWVKDKARGTERYGLLASSEGKRLRAEGIWVPSDINHVGWFLNGKDNVDSSYYLEVAASEFKVQGLEVDYAILAWDADFRYTKEGFDYFKFRGTKWNHVNQERRQRYLKNAYRVLLTRARQGLIIYVPEGSDEDPSRNKDYYDRTYQYLKRTGMEEI